MSSRAGAGASCRISPGRGQILVEGSCRAALGSPVGLMRSFVIHAAFDVLAWLAAAAATLWVTRRVAFPVPEPLRLNYLGVLLAGAALGAYGFGSANLWLSGQPGVGRSIEGAVAGGIFCIELYKR